MRPVDRLPLLALSAATLAVFLRALFTGSLPMAFLGVILLAACVRMSPSTSKPAEATPAAPPAAAPAVDVPVVCADAEGAVEVPVEQAPERGGIEIPIDVAPPCDEPDVPVAGPPPMPPPEVPAQTAAPPVPEPEPPPATPRQPAPVPPASIPVTTSPALECDAVVRSLLELLRDVAAPAAVHLWLTDAWSARLRLLGAAGVFQPAPDPVPLEDEPLGVAADSGEARMTAVASVRVAEMSSTLWRVALPAGGSGSEGVVGIDLLASQEPSLEALESAVASMRATLDACLGLHLARADAATGDAMKAVASALSHADRAVLLEVALDHALDIAAASVASIMLVEPVTGHLRIAVSRGLPDDVGEDVEVSAGEGVAGWVVATRQPVLVEDIPERESHLRRRDVVSSASVPIAAEGHVLGVLNVGSTTFPDVTMQQRVRALESLGRLVAQALLRFQAEDHLGEAG